MTPLDKLPSEEEAEELIRIAFDENQKVWNFSFQHKQGYVFLVKERWWRNEPLTRGSEEWRHFHRKAIKQPEYLFKLNPGEAKKKFFRLSFCLDLIHKTDLIMVAIYYDDQAELEEKRKKRRAKRRKTSTSS